MRPPARAALGVLIAVAVAVAVFMNVPDDTREPVVPAASRSTPAAAVQRSSDAAGPWAALAEATRQADAAHAAKAGERLCGAPFMEGDGDPTPEMNGRLERHFAESVGRHAERLATAPDDLGRLASALLARDFERVGRIARATRDPVVYGLALQQCLSGQPDEDDGPSPASGVPRDAAANVAIQGCAGVTPRGWAELDPDNAAAWWAIAAEATSREAAVVAMTRAMQADHVVALRGQLIRRIAANGADDPATLLPAWIHATGMEAAATVPSWGGLRRACGPSSPEDPVAREQCAAMALDVVVKEPYLDGRVISTRLAEKRYGVPRERLPQSPEALEQLMRKVQTWRMGGFEDGDRFSCGRAERLLRFDIAAAQVGELAAYRRLADPPGAGAAARR